MELIHEIISRVTTDDNEAQAAVNAYKVAHPEATPDELKQVRANYISDRLSGRITKDLTIEEA